MKTRTSASGPKAGKGNKRLLGDEALRFVTGGAKTRRAQKFSTSTIRFDPYKSFKFR